MFDVSEHGKMKIFQVGVISAPGKMNELGICAAAENLRIALGGFLVELCERDDLGWADIGEVVRPREVYLPLALIVFAGNPFGRILRNLLQPWPPAQSREIYLQRPALSVVFS
jgi:hypothetical protein